MDTTPATDQLNCSQANLPRGVRIVFVAEDVDLAHRSNHKLQSTKQTGLWSAHCALKKASNNPFDAVTEINGDPAYLQYMTLLTCCAPHIGSAGEP